MPRIQKILADAGVASRRKAEDLIKQGRVSVDGKVAKIGESAEIQDFILVDNKPIQIEKKVYILLNKPKGFVTTTKEEGKKTVTNLVRIKERIFPVGRLDQNAEGLIFLTNDGNLGNRLIHPRYEITKVYQVEVFKPFQPEDLQKLKKGIEIEGRKVKTKVSVINDKTILLSIHEGRKHIVKKLMDCIDHRVKKLLRTKIGILNLGGIKPGKWRYLTHKEIKLLKNKLKISKNY